jgi:hypothetical protein
VKWDRLALSNSIEQLDGSLKPSIHFKESNMNFRNWFTQRNWLSRAADPETSKMAGEQVNLKLCQRRVYDVIRSYGDEGCILDDLSNRLTNMSSSQRMCELERMGKIQYIGKRKGRLGRYQRVAVATEVQDAQLRMEL